MAGNLFVEDDLAPGVLGRGLEVHPGGYLFRPRLACKEIAEQPGQCELPLLSYVCAVRHATLLLGRQSRAGVKKEGRSNGTQRLRREAPSRL